MVLKKLRSFLDHDADTVVPVFNGSPPQPERPLYAIGDIHGRANLIEPLLEQIDDDLEENGLSDPILIFLGDYVDRGEASADALSHIRDLADTMPDNVVTLMGNHERMMLDFLDDPVSKGAFWLRHGGVQTLASFDVTDISEHSSVDDIIEAATLLSLALPDGTEDWLRNLPLVWSSGNVSCVHAAMDPVRSPDQQRPEALLWGHPDFAEVVRLDGHWVVHGHTVVEKAQMRDGRISVDTGAWYSGCLSAVCLSSASPRFLST